MQELNFKYTESCMIKDENEQLSSILTSSSSSSMPSNIISSSALLAASDIIQDPEVESDINLQNYQELKKKYDALQQKYKNLQSSYQKLKSEHKTDIERYQKKIKTANEMYQFQKEMREQCQAQYNSATQARQGLNRQVEDSNHMIKNKMSQVRKQKYVNEQLKQFAELGIMLQVIPIIAKDEFSLEIENLQNIAEKCLKLYRINHKYSEILIYCFYKHFWQKIVHQGTEWNMEKTQLQIGQKMTILQQKFPPFHKNGIKEVSDTFYPEKKPQRQINLFLKGQFMNQDNIFDQFARIRIQSVKAKAHLERLLNHMIDQVGDKTNKFDICLKIPKNQTNKYKAYLRLIEKIFKDDLKKWRRDIFKEIEQSLSNHSTEERNRIIADSFNAIWKKYIDIIISEKRKKNQSIKCHVYDFLRCKCCFKDEKQLRRGFNFFYNKCRRQIFSIQNKLKEKTKSIVIKIVITQREEPTLHQPIVAEIQLLLQHDKDANEYNHAIFEMGRSPLGYLFGVILVLSQNTCANSFEFCIKDVKTHFDKFLKIVQGWQMPSSKIYIESELLKDSKMTLSSI